MQKRVVVAGGRDFWDYDTAKIFINFCISQIQTKYSLIFVSGGCRGADALGERYAKEFHFPLERYPAEWKTHGKAAGPIRNQKMAEVGDYFICFWDGKSRGTFSLILSVKRLKKPLKIKYYKNNGSTNQPRS